MKIEVRMLLTSSKKPLHKWTAYNSNLLSEKAPHVTEIRCCKLLKLRLSFAIKTDLNLPSLLSLIMELLSEAPSGDTIVLNT